MRLLSLLSLCIVLTLSVFPAYAGENEPQLPGPLKTLADDGAQIRFIGNDLGLNGWVAIKNGQEQYFYATADGQAIISGILFNSKGDTVTLRQINDIRKKEGPALDKLAGFADNATTASPTPTASEPTGTDTKTLLQNATKSKGEQLFDSAVAANWISLGSEKAPALYTFIDPECPHCHNLLQDFRKSGYIEKGLIQLRVIPVGVLSANSLKEASFLLASPTPQIDLFKHLDGDKKALLSDSSLNTQGVERNMKLMQTWNLEVTPFSVYKDRSGTVKIIQGRPKDLKALIAELR